MDPKTAKFNKLLLEDEICDLNQLKLVAWSGIPHKYRPLGWRLLLGYLPSTKSKRQLQLDRKREEYDRLIDHYYNNRSLDDGMWRQIHIDIPRMQPLISVFQQPRVQEVFERVLYIWSIRHPASGYVQGMNDLVTPFFLTYLSEYSDTNTIQEVEKYDVSSLDDATLRNIEADTYWSFGKLLDSIQNNYTHAQPGIQRLVRMLATIVSRVDADLHNHLKSNGVDYLQFAFRWMNNLLIRELPLRLVVRLWDSYLAEGFIATFTTPVTTSTSITNQSNNHQHNHQINELNTSLNKNINNTNSNSTTSNNPTNNLHTNGSETPFSASFHLFVCAAFLKSWSKDLLREQDFQGIMLLLQNLPTYHWSDQEVVMMLADAYHLKETFSPSHLKLTSG